MSLLAGLSQQSAHNTDSAAHSSGFSTLLVRNPTNADVQHVDAAWGPSGEMQIRHELTTFPGGVQDRVMQFGHHPAQSQDGSAAVWLQIEKNFKDTGTGGFSSEIFCQWFGPHASGQRSRRPWQINLAWGAGYSTDGKAEGYTDFSFDGDRFTFGDQGGFDDQVVLSFGSGHEADLWLQPKANSRDVRLRVARYGVSEWLQIDACGAGTYHAGASNKLSISSVSNDIAHNRGISFEVSRDSGASFTQVAAIFGEKTVPYFAAANLYVGSNQDAVDGALWSSTIIAGNVGVWFKQSSPSSANAALSGSASETILNVKSGGSVLLRVANSTEVTVKSGQIGFFGSTAASKPTVSGSRGSNAALASLLTALSTLGLVTDSSS